MVRYTVKPDRLADHLALLDAVFAELAISSPAGLRYAAFRQPDGLTFVHLAIITVDGNPLERVAAFKAFSAGIKDRCDAPPIVTSLESVGSFGL